MERRDFLSSYDVMHFASNRNQDVVRVTRTLGRRMLSSLLPISTRERTVVVAVT